MKTLRMHATVLLAIKEHVENDMSFSAYDITQYIRSKVKSGEWSLISGQTNIRHETVRDYIKEIMAEDLLQYSSCNYTFSRSTSSTPMGDSYVEYYAEFLDEGFDPFDEDDDDVSTPCSSENKRCIENNCVTLPENFKGTVTIDF